jgi:hypothetical protein
MAAHRALTFDFLATYQVDLDTGAATADQVAANGVVISSGACASLNDFGASTLALGTVFTVVSNTAATPIFGAFSNLADGASVTVGSNTYLVSYEGGAGGDLTLTVQ